MKYTKYQKKVPNYYPLTTIFHTNAFQNIPKWDVWFANIPSCSPGEKAEMQILKPVDSTDLNLDDFCIKIYHSSLK
jgi:hypothetical protein